MRPGRIGPWAAQFNMCAAHDMWVLDAATRKAGLPILACAKQELAGPSSLQFAGVFYEPPFKYAADALPWLQCCCVAVEIIVKSFLDAELLRSLPHHVTASNVPR
jgi:hypothetical protein